nr:DUF5712 family protein [Parapedobacter soli]
MNENKPEHWFNGMARDIKPHEVRMGIDRNVAKLGREDSKFFLINIAPAKRNWRTLCRNTARTAQKKT